MSRENSLVSAAWWRRTSTTPRWCWSRSTRTPPPTTRATSRAPSSSTGRPTSRTRSVATSSARPSSRRSCRTAASPTTTPSFRTAATTTGSPPTPTGTSSSTATRTSSCSTARKKWELDSRELVSELPSREATSYTAKEQDLSIRAFRDETVAAIGTRTWSTCARPTSSQVACSPRRTSRRSRHSAGHIPTAANVPWSKAANDDGTFRSDDELKEIYSEAGVDWSKDTIAYCRIGERSSHTWFVLKEILGQENVKNYDGSWTEYGSLVGVPIALGDEPGRPEACAAQPRVACRSTGSTRRSRRSSRAR